MVLQESHTSSKSGERGQRVQRGHSGVGRWYRQRGRRAVRLQRSWVSASRGGGRCLVRSAGECG